MTCEHPRSACELVSRALSSNSGLGGESSEHSREWVARRHGTANQKLLRIKERPEESQMAFPTSSPWPNAAGSIELRLALSAKSALRGSVLGPRSILI